MSYEWLQDIKAGDKVIVGNRYDKNVATVDRVTNTQIIIKVRNAFTGILVDERYKKSTGRRLSGDVFNRSYLKQATDEEVKTVEQSNKDEAAKRWFKERRFTIAEIKKIKKAIGK